MMKIVSENSMRFWAVLITAQQKTKRAKRTKLVVLTHVKKADKMQFFLPTFDDFGLICEKTIAYFDSFTNEDVAGTGDEFLPTVFLWLSLIVNCLSDDYD